MKNHIISIKTKNTVAQLTLYLNDNSPEMNVQKKRPTVLILPGGGYGFVSDREAEPVAIKMMAMGFQAAVLRYNVAPYRFPISLTEVALSIAELRKNSEVYHIDPKKIVVMGFSAGGHLAASIGCFWSEHFLEEETGLSKESIKPDGIILSYPVITSGEFAHRDSIINLIGETALDEWLEKVSLEKQVNKNVPPVFLWHTYTDDVVSVENSLLFANALRKVGISLEMHIYPKGGHGLSLANEETKNTAGYGVQKECQNWVEMAARWVKEL